MSNEISSEIVNFDVMISETKKLQTFCMQLMETPFFKKMGAEGVFAIVQMAKTIGMNPMHALNGELYFTQGRVGMYAEAMSKYIRMKGHSIVTLELTRSKCIIQGKRSDNGDMATITYTIDDARAAGLVKDGSPWTKHPLAMLWSRAMTLLKKVLFADLLANVLTKEELDEMKHDKESHWSNPPIQQLEHIASAFNKNEVISDVPKVSAREADYLTSVLEGCSKEYQEVISNFMKKERIQKFDDLPIDLYEKILKRAEEERTLFLNAKEAELEQEHVAV